MLFFFCFDIILLDILCSYRKTQKYPTSFGNRSLLRAYVVISFVDRFVRRFADRNTRLFLPCRSTSFVLIFSSFLVWRVLTITLNLLFCIRSKGFFSFENAFWQDLPSGSPEVDLYKNSTIQNVHSSLSHWLNFLLSLFVYFMILFTAFRYDYVEFLVLKGSLLLEAPPAKGQRGCISVDW